jgi:hypothetical protein
MVGWDSTTYSNLGDITGTAGTIARFKSGLEISQIRKCWYGCCEDGTYR